jgi:hypothetical protein
MEQITKVSYSLISKLRNQSIKNTVIKTHFVFSFEWISSRAPGLLLRSLSRALAYVQTASYTNDANGVSSKS